jgi:ribosome-associated translation inhibitor RaiA
LKSGAVPLARWEGEGGSLVTPPRARRPRTRARTGATPALKHHALKVHVREDGVEVADELRAHVTRRLGLTLGRFGDAIDRVVVRFSLAKSKLLGERLCQVEVKLRPERLVVEDSANEALAAADHAIDKATRLVTRALRRDDATTPSLATRSRRTPKP